MKRNFFAGSLDARMAGCHPAKFGARNKVLRLVLALLVVSFLGAAYQIHVHAQTQCNAAYAWSPAITSTNTSGPTSAPVNDTAFNLGHSYSYFAQGNQVYAVRNVADADGPAGSIKWALTPNVSSSFNTPTPATLSNGQEVVFVTSPDGNLYKISVADTTTTFVNTQRPGCASDQLRAPATVQLYNSSNAFFKSVIDGVSGHAGDDLVFVITHYIDAGGTCPGGQNRVMAFFASDLSIKWVYNQTGSVLMDVGDSGCLLNYGSNTLICGTEKVGTEASLWAFNTSTSLATGSARWATDTLASIQVSPTLAVTTFGTRLYVATDDSNIRAYNPSNGVFLWTGGVVNTGSPVAHTPAMFKGILLVVDSSATLRAIQDLGTSGAELWSMSATSTGTVRFSSAPVAVESLGKAYVGRNDGTIQEIDLATVQPGEVVVVNPPTADVSDPSLDIEGGASDFNRLVVVAGAINGGVGKVTRLIIPFCAAPTATTTALTSSLNPVGAGDSVTFTATVTSPSGTPTGLVTFVEGASTLGMQTLSSGKAVLTIEDADSLGVGSFPITANYTPDTTSFAASAATIAQTVVMGGVAQTNSNNSFTGNQTIVGTLSATSLVGNGSGLFSLNPASLSPGTAGINVTGTANNALNLGGLPPNAYQPAGSYAMTGANTFIGDQTITGNLTTTGSFAGASGSFTGTLTTGATSLPAMGKATAAQGFFSSPLDLFASSFSSSSGAVNQRFRWQAEPAGNNSANPSGTLNLLFASGGGSPAETGFSINGSGHITFAPGQAFPGTGTATSLNCSGCVGNTQLGVNYAGSAAQGGSATSALVANLATNASALGGVGPSGYAPATGSTVYVAKAGDTMTGDLTLPNLSASGKVSANGSLVVGSGGTAITTHLSRTFSPSFAALKPSTCTALAFTFPEASDGDTVALGVPNAMMTVTGLPNYFAWVSAANTITIRACNLDPNINQKTGASGTIRIDVWKH